MKNLVGLIKSGQNTQHYQSLLNTRPEYMLPFGARYRLIDTTLSNFHEHGITKVLLHGGSKIRSTLDHVGNGAHWEMDKRENGLVITTPSLEEIESNNRRMLSYYESLTFFDEEDIEDIYIANPMVISRVDITSAYKKFKEENYDAMFLYRVQEDYTGRYLNARKIIFDSDGNVENIGINLGTENIIPLFMDHIFIKKEVFMKIVKDAVEKDSARSLSQAIMNYKNELKIGSFEVKSHVEYIRDLQSFYIANLNLLNEGIYADLFLLGSGILTKNKDEPSTLYKEGNKVSNSILANGSIIEGEVSDSVLFRQVKIGKNAIVKNSIIFQGAIIEDGAIVVNSIVDKNAVVKQNVFVQGTHNNPYVVPKNKVLEK